MGVGVPEECIITIAGPEGVKILTGENVQIIWTPPLPEPDGDEPDMGQPTGAET